MVLCISAPQVLTSQSLLLGHVIRDTAEDPVDYAIASLKWDETMEKLQFPLDLTAPRQHQISSWHVLITRAKVISGRWQQGPLAMEITCPPVIMARAPVNMLVLRFASYR